MSITTVRSIQKYQPRNTSDSGILDPHNIWVTHKNLNEPLVSGVWVTQRHLHHQNARSSISVESQIYILSCRQKAIKSALLRQKILESIHVVLCRALSF